MMRFPDVILLDGGQAVVVGVGVDAASAEREASFRALRASLDVVLRALRRGDEEVAYEEGLAAYFGAAGSPWALSELVERLDLVLRDLEDDEGHRAASVAGELLAAVRALEAEAPALTRADQVPVGPTQRSTSRREDASGSSGGLGRGSDLDGQRLLAALRHRLLARSASANMVARAVGGRRQEALRAIREVDAVLVSACGGSSSGGWFPLSGNRCLWGGGWSSEPS